MILPLNCKGPQQLRERRTSFASSSVRLFAAAVLLVSCGRKQPAQHAEGPPEVVVQTVTAQTLPVTMDLPGRIEPMQVAQVRAQASGVVVAQEFQQGSNVKEGQVLYRIDPAPYEAAFDSATATVAQAEATLHQNQLLAERYKPLVAINAVSKQNYDNAVSAAAQAQAGLAAARAAEQTARINLGYTTVTAPISGRIGLALVTQGALVSQTAATPMAVIQQLDPIYFDVTEASAEALKLRQQIESGQLKRLPTGEAKVTLVLPDSTTYSHPGKLLFEDVTVDPTTGMITLRAEFPNPEDWLLPGMFAIGRVEQAAEPNALLVSQPAVSIGPNGQASVMRLTPGDQVEAQPVELGSAVGTNWVIKAGLKAGEQVIVEGLQKVHPGMKVKPVTTKPGEAQ
ncbi:MAG: efflux RND transporter periplasmic adaptor subunit [Limisphaerales bacterium]